MRYKKEGYPLKIIQNNLKSNQTILTYFIGPEHHFLIGINHSNVQIFRLNQAITEPLPAETPVEMDILASKSGIDLPPSLETMVDQFIGAIQNSETNTFLDFGAKLYFQLVHPANSLLDKAGEVLISPYGVLKQLPFDALINKSVTPEKAKYSKLPYLIKNFRLESYPTASFYFQKKENKNVADSTFLGVAPIIDEQTISGVHRLLFDTSYQNAVGLKLLVPDGRNIRAFPESENELAALKVAFTKNKKKAQINLKKQATEERFKNQAREYQIVHLSAPSFINTYHPAASGIIFAQPEIDINQEDGILFAAEIYDLYLNADVVVLNHLSRDKNQDGSFLTTPILSSGVSNILLPRWNNKSAEKVTFLESFYEQLAEGIPAHFALRDTKLKLIKNKKTADPKIWSSWTLVGKD